MTETFEHTFLFPPVLLYLMEEEEYITVDLFGVELDIKKKDLAPLARALKDVFDEMDTRGIVIRFGRKVE